MPSKPVVYISGPMSGCVDLNFPAFDYAETELRVRGWRVINPANFGSESAWSAALARDMTVIPSAKVICTLPGWQDSSGAMMECTFALKCGISCHPLSTILMYSTAEDFLYDLTQEDIARSEPPILKNYRQGY